MEYAYWYDDVEAWDNVRIGGILIPVPRESAPSAEPKKKVKKKSSPRTDGGTIIDLGYELTDVTISVMMWERVHHDAWQYIMDILRPPAGQTRSRPVDVSHPALTAANITRMVVTSFTPPRFLSAGMYGATIKGIEYQEPRPSRSGRQRANGRDGNGAGRVQIQQVVSVRYGGAVDVTMNGRTETTQQAVDIPVGTGESPESDPNRVARVAEFTRLDAASRRRSR